jgi:ankyrin repeat/SAM/basic leucine zipper domain-containing protein 1
MAETSNFRPAGFSSDEDEEGFSFADPIKCPRTRIQTQTRVRSDKPVNDVDLLRVAALNGNIQLLRSLIEEKHLPVDVITQGWTPLMFAASNCQYDAIEFLLKKGANPNFHQHGYSVLMSACTSTKQTQELRLKCVQLLLDSGANVNMRQRNGMTPLMMACKEGSEKIVDEMIKGNADINGQDVMGWTPLIWSVHHSKYGEMEIILLLLNAGADVTVKCFRGQTAHTHALNLGYQHIAAQIPTGETDIPASFKTEHAPTKFDSWEYLRDNLCGINGTKLVLWQDIARSLDHLGILRRYGGSFKESEMDIIKFLTLTEGELEALSVIPLHRKRLLDKTRKLHLKRWKEKSLDMRKIKNMQNAYNMVDEIKLIANIARQITMVRASIAYIGIHMSPSYESESDFKVEDLNLKVDNTLIKTKALHKELQSYVLYSATYLRDHKYPPDWIGPDKSKMKLRHPFVVTVVAMSVIGIIFWKYRPYLPFHSNVFTGIPRLYQSILVFKF